jgi:hypothetical protein
LGQRRSRHDAGKGQREQSVRLTRTAVALTASGEGDGIDQREQIVDADVGADGPGIGRALEEGAAGRGDHRVAGPEAAGSYPLLVGGHGGR